MNPVVITILAFAVPLLVVLWFAIKWFRGLTYRSSSGAGNRSKWTILSIATLVLATAFGGWIGLSLSGLALSFVWMHFMPGQTWFKWSTAACGLILLMSLVLNQSAKTKAAKETRIAEASQGFRKSELIARAKARGKIVNEDAAIWEGTLETFDVATHRYVPGWSGQEVEILVWEEDEFILQMEMQDGSILHLEYDEASIGPQKGEWTWSSRIRREEGRFSLSTVLSGPASSKGFGGIITGLPLPKGQTGVFPPLEFRFIPNRTLADVIRKFVE